MITVLVQFDLPSVLDVEQSKERFLASANTYQSVQGLIRKYYLLAEDGKTAGGVYLWESRALAEVFYNEEWKNLIIGRYGAAPVLTYFDSPVVVDNLAQKIVTD